MKISLVGPFPPYRGGIADFNAALYLHLHQKHQVQTVNFRMLYPALIFPGKTQYKRGPIAQEVASEALLSSVNPLSWRRAARRIVDQAPELVVFRYWMPFFAPALGFLARRIKRRTEASILAICDNIVPHEPQPWDRFLTRYFLGQADYFIVMSRSVEQDLLTLYPQAVYRYSPHPVYDIFGPGLEKTEARRRLGLKSRRVILYFGLIRPYKGLDILIRAARQLQTLQEDFTILVVGECYQDPEGYRQLARENGVEDVFDWRLEFVPDDEVGLYFSAADVVALPYKTATQSGIVQIAYHFNRPVIVTRVGGLPEIVADGEVGYVVPPESSALAEALGRFFREDRFEEFSANIAGYKDRFSWSRMITTIEELAAV